MNSEVGVDLIDETRVGSCRVEGGPQDPGDLVSRAVQVDQRPGDASALGGGHDAEPAQEHRGADRVEDQRTDRAPVELGEQPALVGQAQDVNAYDPEGKLPFSQTFYWRVDEVNISPDKTVHTGGIWSFEVEPMAIPVTPMAV